MSPVASVRVEPHEDGHPNTLIVLVDLDVVETIRDASKELDTECLIIRSDVDPVPWHGPWVRAGKVWNSRISTHRVAKKGFLLPLGYSSHTRIVYHLATASDSHLDAGAEHGRMKPVTLRGRRSPSRSAGNVPSA